MNKIFILNAPPQTGKDTIANYFTGKMIIENTTCFKYPMLEIAATVLGISFPQFLKLYTDNKDNYKDSPASNLQGATIRQLLIHTSENFIKPFFGPRYFGEKIADKIEFSGRKDESWIIPDGGFQDEVDALVDRFGDRVVVIQLSREGHETFAGDSRGWVDGPTVMCFNTTEGNDKVIEYISSTLDKK